MSVISKEEILAGRKVEADEFWLTPKEFQDLVVRTIRIQADGEMAARHIGYFPQIVEFPDPNDHWLAAKIGMEEVGHYLYANKVLNAVGIDASERVWVKPDERFVGFFGTQMTHWSEVMVFKGVAESLGRMILEEFFDCSFAPWARMMRTIWQEEKGHIGFGVTRLRKLVRSEEGLAIAQDAVDKWFPRLFFFKPGNDITTAVRDWKIRTRTNEEIVIRFYEEMRQVIGGLGLSVPEIPEVWRRYMPSHVAGMELPESLRPVFEGAE
jgi:ring-1,2-phenylacetyl-CoA epoxidase subunit PaaA